MKKLTPEQRRDLDKKLRKVKVPFKVLDHEDDEFTEDERKDLLSMTRSLFAYVGCVVPQVVIMDDGTKIDLHGLVWDLISKPELTDREVVAARQLALLLKKKAKQNELLIEMYDLTDYQAERLYFQTCGLLRAVMELRGLGQKDREDEYGRLARKNKVNDARRLLAFFKNVKL